MDRYALAGDGVFPEGITEGPGATFFVGSLWLAEPGTGVAMPVDLGGYEFNADGMLLDGDLLYGVTNRGEIEADVRFMISVARLASDWRSGQIIGELRAPAWDCPITIAKVAGKLLVVSSQIILQRTGGPPKLPFEVIATNLPTWD